MPLRESIPKQCRYGLQCRNPMCWFEHPESWNMRSGTIMRTATKPYPVPTKRQTANCRDGLNCTRQDCYFVHPEGRDTSKCVAIASPTKETSPSSAPPKPCRYGANCTRRDCKFTHPIEGREENADSVPVQGVLGAKARLVSALRQAGSEELPKRLPVISDEEEAAFAKYVAGDVTTTATARTESSASMVIALGDGRFHGDCFEVNRKGDLLVELKVHIVDVSCIFLRSDVSQLERHARLVLDTFFDGDQVQKIFTKTSCEAARFRWASPAVPLLLLYYLIPVVTMTVAPSSTLPGLRFH